MHGKLIGLFLGALVASGWTPGMVSAQHNKGGGGLPPLPTVNSAHFVVLASATGNGAKGVQLRIILPVSGPAGPESWKQKTAVVDGKNWRVVDVKGRPVDPKSLPNALNKLTPVLLALEEQPDPFHLRTTKEDCLIVIGPKDAIQRLEDPEE